MQHRQSRSNPTILRGVRWFPCARHASTRPKTCQRPCGPPGVRVSPAACWTSLTAGCSSPGPISTSARPRALSRRARHPICRPGDGRAPHRRGSGSALPELGGAGLPCCLRPDCCATAQAAGVRRRQQARSAPTAPVGGVHRHRAPRRARARGGGATTPLSCGQAESLWPGAPNHDLAARAGRDGRVVLVTGSTRGWGIAISRKPCLQAGAVVAARFGRARGAVRVR